MKEEQDNIRILLEKIKYADHQWKICGDLKIATIILGQQGGFTKNPCFLCLWNVRDREKHYKQNKLTIRNEMTPGSNNVIKDSLVDRLKILLPPLHIKLGLITQFVKALDKEGDCFKYITQKFHLISLAKLKTGILDGPHIRKLLRDDIFITKMKKD